MNTCMCIYVPLSVLCLYVCVHCPASESLCELIVMLHQPLLHRDPFLTQIPFMTDMLLHKTHTDATQTRTHRSLSPLNLFLCVLFLLSLPHSFALPEFLPSLYFTDVPSSHSCWGQVSLTVAFDRRVIYNFWRTAHKPSFVMSQSEFKVLNYRTSKTPQESQRFENISYHIFYHSLRWWWPHWVIKSIPLKAPAYIIAMCILVWQDNY